jgi:hypothetical protein
MLSVRGLLLLAWLVLIASLFWDPYSAALTDPRNTASPFRITSGVIQVQGHDLTVTPYSLSARIFWTMVVPIVPFFLMVFGHEAWRRICPLSLASQIPGYLGLRRHRSRLERRTGHLRRAVALLDRQNWFASHSWYVQFSFLFTGIAMRLLFINTDRQAMGIALLAVIGAAILTGVLWGGKTWCNYFCPANVVQKIYTEPGGIFESTPHFSRPILSQSMCRKPSAKGDVSVCVACTPNCGDIDLQRSYWNGVRDPQRRNVYYMFFGLIVGFYGYYYLYAGNWDYYFSGVWTHEDGIRQKLFAPGFFILGHAVPIPKVVAAPLTLAIACAIALVLGRGLEALYCRQASREEGVSEQVLIHRCLSFTAWLSINAFYIFGGRPNILLLPAIGTRLVDIAVVTLSTIWLRRALQHTPIRYQQESMASSLLAELRKLKVNVSKFLEGRKLEHLKANEIYLLSKILPGFSQQQKLEAYRKILDEAITAGSTASTAAVKLLEDFRTQMSITEEEHTMLLEELGLPNVVPYGSNGVTEDEKAASLNYYRTILSSTVATRLDIGVSIGEILNDPVFQSSVDVLRQSLQITEHEHQAAIEELSSGSGIVNAKMDETLDALLRHKSIRLCLEAAEISVPLGRALMSLLLDALVADEQAIQIEALSIMRNFRPDPEVQRHAEDLVSLSGHDLDLILRQDVPNTPTVRWRDVLHPKIFAILSREASAETGDEAGFVGERRSHRKAVLASLDVESNLAELLALEEPLIRAIGLVVCGYIKPKMAREAAELMLADERLSDHPLLLSTIEQIVGGPAADNSRTSRIILHAIAQVAGQPDAVLASEKDCITIGRAVDNDIAVAGSVVLSHHVQIRADHGEVRLIRLDGGVVFVNGSPVQEGSIALKKNSVISLGNLAEDAPKITIDWESVADTSKLLHVHPILLVAMLSQNNRLGHLSLGALADIAGRSRPERYVRGARLETVLAEERYFLIYQGQIRLFDLVEGNFLPDTVFGPGDLVGSDLIDLGSSILPEVVSDFAIVMHVPPTLEAKEATPRRQPGGPKRSGTAIATRAH